MMIPTEPNGSIPRPPELVAAIRGGAGARQLAPLLDAAVRETVAAFEATGAPVISDGEQGKLDNFWCYPVHGAANTAPDGFRIPLSDGSKATRQRMPRLTDPCVESAEQVRDRVLLAARYLEPRRLGTTDDAGFAPFFDDDRVSRATAFAKLRARVEGTCLAAALLEGAA